MHKRQKGRIRRRIIFLIGILILIPLLVLFFNARSQQKEQSSVTSTTISPHWKTYDEQVANGEIEPAGKILEVGIQYNANSNQPIQITRVQRKNGYAPQVILSDNRYRLQLLDINHHVVSEQPFSITTQIRNEPKGPDGKRHGLIINRSVITTAATMDWQDTGASVQIVNTSGKRFATSDLTQMSDINNKPEFQTVQGIELLTADKPSPKIIPIIQKAYAIDILRTKLSDGKLDIAIVSNGFTEFTEFNKLADTLSQGFVTYEPYKSRASQVAFHKVENKTDLKCNVETIGTVETVSCDDATVTQASNSFGVPHDIILIIVNNTKYLASGGPFITMSSGVANPSPGQLADTAVHELGHTIGFLMDEYDLYGKDGTLDNKVHFISNGLENPDPNNQEPPGQGNCYAGNPPAADWSGVVTDADYRKICTYPNWYASSQDSVMAAGETNQNGTSTIKSFNKVSLCIMNKRLDTLLGALPGISTGCSDSASPPAPSGISPTFVCGGSTNSICPTPTLLAGNPLPSSAPISSQPAPLTAAPTIGNGAPINLPPGLGGLGQNPGNGQGGLTPFLLLLVILILNILFGA